MTRATQPSRENYERELNRLIESRTRQSDLKGAVAARDALNHLAAAPGENEAAVEFPVGDAELDRLRSVYEEDSERSVKPLRETYLRELNKILQTRTRSSDLSGALLAKTELERVTEEGERHRTDPLEALFVGRTWVSQAGTAFIFAADGKCIRETQGRREGTWKRRGSVVISSIEGSPRETRYFRFESKTEAYYGTSDKEMNIPVIPR